MRALLATVALATGVLTCTATASAGPPDVPAEEPQDVPPPPSDPNDAPFMRAPNGQLPTWSAEPDDMLSRGYSPRRRLQLTVAPSYAVFRLPFVGRTPSSQCRENPFSCQPIRGVGVSVEGDVRLLRWLSLRIQGLYSAHPVDEEVVVDQEDEEVRVQAAKGVISATNAGVGLVYPLDLGRIVPLVDFGGGLFWIRTPEGVRSQQVGQSCSDANECDVGLACASDGVCRPSVLPELHAGIGMDVLLGRHWAVGGQFRYFAVLMQPSVFPVFLVGSIRLSARW